jgi:Spy/CpxP family protein refolding chaperone
MKKIFLMCLMCTFTFSMMAQREGGNRGGDRAARAEKRLETLKQELKLSDKQVKDLKAIEDEFAAKARASRGEGRELSEKAKEDLKVARDKVQKKYKELLSEEQYKKFQELQKKEASERENRGRAGNGNGNGNRGNSGNRRN